MLTYQYLEPQELIDSEDFNFVKSFLEATGRTQIGWHYIIDIVWIYSRVKSWSKDYKILDVGGGTGPIQFFLAELGFNVTNIDMMLSAPSPAYEQRYQTSVETLPSFVPTSYKKYLLQYDSLNMYLKDFVKNMTLYRKIVSNMYFRRHERWKAENGINDVPLGNLEWIVGNLCYMPEISDGTFDAVVSLSALEHIPLVDLGKAVKSINRVSKSNAKWAVTTSGTEKRTTWFHEPSQGLNFSEKDLLAYFCATPHHIQDASTVLENYRQCSYLKENLAKSYFGSDKNGMPFGEWNPTYIPVGLSC